MEHTHSGRCVEFKHNSTPVNSKSKGPSVRAAFRLSIKGSWKANYTHSGASPLLQGRNALQILCALQASTTVIAGGKKHGFSLFLPTFQSGKLLPSLPAELGWTQYFFKHRK